MTAAIEGKTHYLTDFDLLLRKAVSSEPVWFRQLRKDAISSFTQLSFPTIRDEDWRFTSVDPIVRVPFRSNFETPVDELANRGMERFPYENKNWQRLTFVNGMYVEKLSAGPQLKNGIRVNNLADAVVQDPHTTQQYLARYAAFNTNPFSALNTAFIRDGAFVYVPAGRILEHPIEIAFLSLPGKEQTVTYPRTLIVLGRGSMATVIERYVCVSNGSYFTNAVTEIVLGEGSVVDYYKIQVESERAFHIATTQVHQDRDSRFSSFSFSTGADVARNDLNVILSAEGSECMLNGLYLVTSRQHVDNHTFIEHAKPHGNSKELYKGILDGKSSAVFNGRILVRKDAQQTDAHQTNKNLFLSDEAKVNTNPQLEILADDVKCTHGATVGQLDDEVVFYLKTRGMTQQAARAILTQGFANDIINLAKVEPVRAQLGAFVAGKLRNGSYAKEIV